MASGLTEQSGEIVVADPGDPNASVAAEPNEANANSEETVVAEPDSNSGDKEAVEAEPDDANASDTESVVPETNDTSAGDEETVGDTNAGDIESEEAEPEDVNTGDTETVVPQSDDANTGDKETVEAGPDEADAGDNETEETEPDDTNAGDEEIVGDQNASVTEPAAAEPNASAEESVVSVPDDENASDTDPIVPEPNDENDGDKETVVTEPDDTNAGDEETTEPSNEDNNIDSPTTTTEISVTPEIPSTPVDFICESVGRFPVPNSCNKYYYCWDTIHHTIFACPHVFDPKTQYCGNNFAVCESAPKCEADKQIFPNFDDETTFYECKLKNKMEPAEYELRRKDCARGREFDAELGYCVQIGVADTSSESHEHSENIECKRKGYLIDYTNESRFYKCELKSIAKGTFKAVRCQCPDHEVFSMADEKCIQL